MANPDILVQASGLLEDVARLALVTATRASRLRLPCETYTPILDDDPLPQGTVSSSIMRVRCPYRAQDQRQRRSHVPPGVEIRGSAVAVCPMKEALSAQATHG